jgi:excisionase family DNA binding protein
VQRAAGELEVTTRTIYRFINDGKLPAYRIGRVYRIRRADLGAFLTSAALQPGDLDHLVEDGKDGQSTSDDHESGSRESTGAPVERVTSAE